MRILLALTASLLLISCGNELQIQQHRDRDGEILLGKSLHVPITETNGVTDLAGKHVNLDEMIAGKPTILNFWASWCAFCASELPAFEEASKIYPGIKVIAINMQENSKAVTSFWQRGGFTFHTLLDPKSELKSAFSVVTQPTTIFINDKGEIVERRDGPLTEAEIHLYAERIAPRYALVPPSNERETEHRRGQEISSTPPFLSHWSKKFGATIKHSIALDDFDRKDVTRDTPQAITNPRFTSIDQAKLTVKDDDTGMLFAHNGTMRFYPSVILNSHQIINDNIDGYAYMVTFCPRCDSGAVYKRDTSVGSPEFGVSGFHQDNNMIMYDHATDSLWHQIEGKAIVGELTGDVLELLPGNMMTFGELKSQYGDAEILLP